jgi:hypothetical protein
MPLQSSVTREVWNVNQFLHPRYLNENLQPGALGSLHAQKLENPTQASRCSLNDSATAVSSRQCKHGRNSSRI